VPFLSPAAHNVETFAELRYHLRNIGRVVLQVGVHRDNDFPLRVGEAGAQRRGLSEVPAKANDPNFCVGLLQFRQYGEALVGAAVVDEYYFVGS